MSQSDLFSWKMERDPALRSTIVAVLTLDTDPDWDRLVRTIDRGTRIVPKLRHRLVTVPFGLAPPRWTPDPEFDLSWHLRRAALPEPANLSAVLEFARAEAMTAFDPVRPMWRSTLLSGLDGTGSALVLTVHHSLTDGIGGIQIATEVLDFDRVGTERSHQPEPPSDRDSGLRDILAWNWSVGSELFRSGITAAAPTAWRAFTHPVRAVRDGAALATSLVRLVHPATTTLSQVMTERGLGRRLAVLDIPVARLHRAAHAVGCSMNDAFLTAVLIGLRTYHDRHGSRVEYLRLTMPISVRTADDPLGGNRITLARFILPVDIAGPMDLMRAVHTVVGSWRREPAIPLTGAVAGALNRLPVGLLTDMFKHVDFLASNVPGSSIPLFLAGARIDRMYAFAPTLGTAVNVTLTSHAGTCNIGVNADTAAIPDLAVLVDCLCTGFDIVAHLGGEREVDDGSGMTAETIAPGVGGRGSSRWPTGA
ncbi:wax ester/triacylglycerol synthase domain-containing protein [Nocardia sp. NPDC049190]|uniref:wax ester/triacylglycerol synthase domain-containing protein n=1 Tax=Nocardia sp. NPDC049190 TaxID=3155650 RepID=UPI0033C8C45F